MSRSIQDFIKENGLDMYIEPSNSNPNNPDWKDANHYMIHLKNGSEQFTTYFSMGLGLKHQPLIEYVLNCLANDAMTLENCPDFEDWAYELGYNPDSRKAEKIFNAVTNQSAKLRNFLGKDLYEELLWDVKREQ
jgi:hypothetical protein